MPLKTKVKPNDLIVINGAVVRPGGRHGELLFLNHARILHQKDIISEERIRSLEEANGGPRHDCRLYWLIQLLYIDPEHAGDYVPRIAPEIKALRIEHPEKASDIDPIVTLIANGRIFDALKACRAEFPDCLGTEKPAVNMEGIFQ